MADGATTPLWDQLSESGAEAESPFDLGKKGQATIRSEPAAIESGFERKSCISGETEGRCVRIQRSLLGRPSRRAT